MHLVADCCIGVAKACCAVPLGLIGLAVHVRRDECSLQILDIAICQRMLTIANPA